MDVSIENSALRRPRRLRRQAVTARAHPSRDRSPVRATTSHSRLLRHARSSVWCAQQVSMGALGAARRRLHRRERELAHIVTRRLRGTTPTHSSRPSPSRPGPRRSSCRRDTSKPVSSTRTREARCPRSRLCPPAPRDQSRTGRACYPTASTLPPGGLIAVRSVRARRGHRHLRALPGQRNRRPRGDAAPQHLRAAGEWPTRRAASSTARDRPRHVAAGTPTRPSGLRARSATTSTATSSGTVPTFDSTNQPMYLTALQVDGRSRGRRPGCQHDRQHRDAVSTGFASGSSSSGAPTTTASCGNPSSSQSAVSWIPPAAAGAIVLIVA